jgi:cytochrome c-type biogenesis protein CcmH/NrfG
MEASMSRGLLPGLFACALMVALAPIPALAQTAAADPGSTAADDKEARDLFQIGKDAFDEGRFERALKYFQDAYSLSHRAALLSNIGTAADRLRRDQEAVDAYKKYLEQVPQAPNRRLIEERIRIIESALSKSRPAPPAVEPTAPAPFDPTPAPTPQPTTAQPTNQMTKASEAPGPIAPTPEQTARATFATPSDVTHPTDKAETPVTSRWWFWTGIGAVAVAAVVVVVAVSAGGSSTPQQPTLLDPKTRVREL